jgi:hypothetical protein
METETLVDGYGFIDMKPIPVNEIPLFKIEDEV